MASKPKNPAAAKAAKQKKVAIALSVVLVLALAYAFHTMQGLHKGTPEPVAATVSTSTATTTTPAAPAATPAAAPVSTAPTVLVAAVRPSAGSGQLESFSRFDSKDPFAGGGPDTGPATAPAAPSASAPAATPAKPSAPATSTPTAFSPPPPPTTAVIAVNGVAASVAVAADFPVSPDPTQNALFHLVALTAKTATVSVVGGSYASGAPTLKLQVDRPVTLVNTADGKRYTLQLFPQGTPAPAAPTAPTAPTTTTAAATP